jgi:Glycosyl transferases group 1/Glycosyl transferase 4-like domain
MRVLAVTNMYPTEAEPWFGSFVKDQIEAVRRRRVTVEVLSFDGRQDVRAYASAAVSVKRLASAEKFDLIHAHYGLTGAVALFQRSLPVVTTFHGSDSAQIGWQRRLSWLVARRSTPIFVAPDNARTLGLPDAPIVPAGVDTVLFKPRDRRRARADLGWAQDRMHVLLPGARSNRVKRADVFDQVVDLVGRTVRSVRGVSLEGYSREEVANVMNAVDVVLLTSDSEGSPVTVKEALACGTPVVSVPVGDVATVLGRLPGCAIVPREPSLLADAVLASRTVRDPSLRQRALEFSYERMADHILKIYEGARLRSHRRLFERGR